MDQEIWVPVYGYEESYEISNFGQVKAKFRKKPIKGRWGTMEMSFPEKIMKLWTDKKGYKYVGLSKDSNVVKFLVHRIVLYSFVGKKDMPCNHIDGDKANNKLNNLEYCTCYENNLHAREVLGKNIKGSKHWRTRLNEDQVRLMRLDERPVRVLSEIYGISTSAIRYIKSGRNWSHVK